MSPGPGGAFDTPAITIHEGAPNAEWDRYVETHPDGTACHFGAWAGVMERVFGHETRYLAARVDDRIAGILPLVLFKTALFGRFATSMPFLNYGGVVADDDRTAARLLDAAIDVARGARSAYLELRHTTRRFEQLPVQTHKVVMVLPLRGTVGEQWDALDRKLRNQVRKAEKSGLTIEIGGEDALDGFHDVLVHNMRDLGSPVHSKRFFLEILRAFPERTRIVRVLLGSTTVAASFLLWRGSRLEVPWASAIRQYNPLCANVLLYWAMLTFGVERGFAEFDFGRSTPHEGTYRFKEQWGAEPRQLYWEYWMSPGRSLPDRSPKNPKFSRAIAVWQRLPLPLTRVLGPLVIRGIP